MYVISEIESLLNYKVEKVYHNESFSQIVLNNKEVLDKNFFEKKNQLEIDYGVTIEPLYWNNQYSIFIRYRN